MQNAYSFVFVLSDIHMPAPNTMKYCLMCFAKPLFQPTLAPPQCFLCGSIFTANCQRHSALLQLPLPGQARGLVVILYCMIYDSVYVHLLH